MTTPSKAQIEAAAKAIAAVEKNKDAFSISYEAFAVAALTAAAQVGEPVEDRAAQKIIEPIIKDAITVAVNATIERCAQAMEEFRGRMFSPDIAARHLRALKEQP